MSKNDEKIHVIVQKGQKVVKVELGGKIRPIDANAAIEQLRANFQQGSWCGCEETCYQIAEDTISEMPTIYAAPSDDPLTLEHLREMDGKPVWVEFEDGSGGLWGIVHISVFEQIVFPDSLHCTIGHPYYGKTYKAYAYPPAHIDRKAWEPCECCKRRTDMDYKEQAENLLYDAKDWAGDPHIKKDLHGAAQSITDLLARVEAAEAKLTQKESYYNQMVDALAATDSFEKQKLCEEADHLKDLLKEAEARAEKAERERDAAIKELEDVASAVDHFSDFIDEQIHPLVQYDIYTALRENADAISMWQYENEWRGQKEE